MMTTKMLAAKVYRSIAIFFVIISADKTFSLPQADGSQLLSPYFSSRQERYREREGATVILNCRVENIGSSTVLWKKDGRMLTVGQSVIRKDERMSLVGESLKILGINEADSGEYICEIETYGAPLSQVHTLEVLIPPKVESVPLDGRIVVRTGSTIRLECRARGNPSPTVTWARQDGEPLPSGEKTSTGLALMVQDVYSHHAGKYICTANNGVGHPAESIIDLHVLYPPEVTIHQTWLKSRDSIDAQITCIVHAEPLAEVEWYKETMLLENSHNRHMDKNKRTLTVKHVSEKDFGNYSCLAVNTLGRETKTAQISGRPHKVEVTSPSLSFYKNKYNLTWKVESFLNVEEYRILYRLDQSNTIEDHLSSKKSEWTNIIPTSDSNQLHTYHNNLTYTSSFNFYGLEADSQYEVIIQSRNREGWSEPSQIFRFSTRNTDYNPRELEVQRSEQHGYLHSSANTNRCGNKYVPMALIMTFLTLSRN